jgi:hypothetical protein
MDIGVIVSRILHIGLGVFWVGSVLYSAVFLEPAVRATGAAGGAVMGAIAQRRFVEIMLVSGILTVLSGLHLFAKVSGGFDSAYMTTAPGIAYLTGAVAAISVLLIGVFVSRPTMQRIGQMTAAAMALPEGPERGAAMAAIGPLRAKMTGLLRIAASLLLLTLLTMAVGRYL